MTCSPINGECAKYAGLRPDAGCCAKCLRTNGENVRRIAAALGYAGKAAAPAQAASKAVKTPTPDNTLIPGSMTWEAERHTGQPRVSFVILARNEGDEVLRTARNAVAAGADEIVIVDDASTDGSCDATLLGDDDRLKRVDLQIVRHAAYEGVSASRNDGMAAASGDVLWCGDAHVRGPRGCLRELSAAALEYQAIICPGLVPISDPYDVTAYGAALKWRPEKATFWHPEYTRPHAERYSRVTCPYGSVYGVPRQVYRRMSGSFLPCGWIATWEYGYNEQAFAMAAYFAGVPVLAVSERPGERWDAGQPWTHLIKSKSQNTYDSERRVLNYWTVPFIVFERETFEGFFLPALNKVAAHDGWMKQGAEAWAAWASKDPGLLAEEARFKAVKRASGVTDEQFFVEVISGPERARTVPQPMQINRPAHGQTVKGA